MRCVSAFLVLTALSAQERVLADDETVTTAPVVDDHSDHDHGDETVTTAPVVDDHSDHDHGDETTVDEDDHSDHDHAHDSFEWSGIVQPAGQHVVLAASLVDGTYPSAEMIVAALTVSDVSHAALDAAGEEAATLWEAAEHLDGSMMQPGHAYVLDFNQNSWVSTWKINASGASALAIFTQYHPTEFTATDVPHLKLANGAEVEILEAETASTESTDRWGSVILGSFITCLPTLIGILAIIPKLEQVKAFVDAYQGIISSFCSGVLLSAATLFVLPEALLTIGTDRDEVEQAWMWGAGVMGGWLMAVAVAQACNVIAAGMVRNTDEKPETFWGVALPVTLGDMFHNFADGLVIGFAFKSCSTSFAWTLVGASVGHEVPQEIADFVVLIHKAHVKIPHAVAINFLTGLTSVLGAVLAYGVDVDDHLRGAFLAIGGGVYIYVALTEVGPEIREVTTAADMVKRLGAFAVGAVAIGLALLNHEHCDVPGGALDAHAGHDH